MNPDKKTRHTKRLILIIAPLVVIILGAILLLPGILRNIAVSELTNAEQDGLISAAKEQEAQTQATSAREALIHGIESAGAALELKGVGIPEMAYATFSTARDTALRKNEEAGEFPPEVFRVFAKDINPESLSELNSARQSLLEWSGKLSERALKLEELTEKLTIAHQELLTAADSYTQEITATGLALLQEQKDAATEPKQEIQKLIDALKTSELSNLAERLMRYRSGIDELIASAEFARKPSPGGSGLRITNPEALDVLVNKRRGLPADYVPPGLVSHSLPGGAGPIRQEVFAPLEQLRDALKAETGLDLRSVSAYRSYQRQQTIYDGYVASQGVSGADTHSARPGNSEHQTGLALDFDDGLGCSLSRCFRDTPGGQWLAENAWKYGFILRYPEGLEHIVGYAFEPWHYRYIGVEISTAMRDKGITTLEEYFGLPPAPDYG